MHNVTIVATIHSIYCMVWYVPFVVMFGAVRSGSLPDYGTENRA